MIYRMRIYKANVAAVDAFNEFFNSYLLPVQLRAGARLIGRWQTEDCRIVAIWEYDTVEAYQSIQAMVQSDPESEQAQVHRRTLPDFFVEREEVFMTDTVAK